MNKQQKNIVFFFVIIALFFLGLGCFFLDKSRQKDEEYQKTNPVFAEIALKNLAVGMRTYSSMMGGGGNTIFTGDVSKIKDYVMQDAMQAMPGEKQLPYNGYVFELTEKPQGDNYKNNFRFVARPANGFIGQSFQIDKFEQVTPID